MNLQEATLKIIESGVGPDELIRYRRSKRGHMARKLIEALYNTVSTLTDRELANFLSPHMQRVVEGRLMPVIRNGLKHNGLIPSEEGPLTVRNGYEILACVIIIDEMIRTFNL